MSDNREIEQSAQSGRADGSRAEWGSAKDAGAALREVGYLPDEGLASAVFLSIKMQRPLLLEGQSGVGKTSLARALATVFGAELIRLQCYEGIDATQALYEWQYSRQLLALRGDEDQGANGPIDIYSEEFLAERPILRAIRLGARAVLLVDEVDRADDQFEAYLLEALSEFSVSIPELGTVRADSTPLVVLTSNRTRELHDALKRRCIYHWVDHPEFERELEIVSASVPAAAPGLAKAVVEAAQALRGLHLQKPPGTAEVIDWTTSLATLGIQSLDSSEALGTVGMVAKNREDHRLAREFIESAFS